MKIEENRLITLWKERSQALKQSILRTIETYSNFFIFL